MRLSTVKIPISFGFDLFWSSLSFSTLKPIFLPNLFALFLYYIKWDPSLVNISETIAGDRLNQFVLLTEHKFCRKLSRSISVDIRFCNRFINLGRQIFSLNHCGASVVTVFTIQTTIRIAHGWPPNLQIKSVLLFHQPITSPKLYLPSGSWNPSSLNTITLPSSCILNI